MIDNKRKSSTFNKQTKFTELKTLNKIVVVLLFVFIGITSSYGQMTRQVQNLPNYNYAKYHFGATIGVNYMIHNIIMKPGAYDEIFTGGMLPNYEGMLPTTDAVRLVEATPIPSLGITLAVPVTDLRLNKSFNLRLVPAISFGNRSIKYVFQEIDGVLDANDTTFSTTIKQMPSTYLEIPLSIKYRSLRMHNLSSYLLGGVKYMYDFYNQQKRQDRENNNVQDFYLLPKKHVFSWELGAGFDFYADYFKFGAEVKFAYSLGDIFSEHSTPYTHGIKSGKSKILYFTLTFE